MNWTCCCFPGHRLHAVWPNYDMEMFQTHSGTAPCIGSVANITSFLSPSHRFNCFMYPHPSPSISWLPSHPPPFDWAALIFAPDYHPSSVIGPPVHLDKRPLPPASTACPCAHCLASINMLPRSLSSPAALLLDLVSSASSPVRWPPFSALDVDNSPFNTCGFALLVFVLPSLFLKPPIPPDGLNLQPGPYRYQGGSWLHS